MPNKTQRVAIIYDATLPCELKVMDGVASYVHEIGSWSVYIEEYALRDQRLPDLNMWRGDGVLADFDDPRVARAVAGLRIPVVGFGGGYGWYDRASKIPYFFVNNEAISRLAAEHFLERGFRRFAYCGLPPTRINGWSKERGRAFRRYAEEAGGPCSVYAGRIRASRHWGLMITDLCRWLESLEKPVGLMAATDKRARQVLEACRLSNIRVPEDIAVIGVDNDEMLCRLATPPLSSVKHGTWRLGYEAAKLLDQMMAGKKSPKQEHVIDPDGIVSRRSTDIFAIEDADVARTMRFIHEHASEGIKVPNVVEAVGGGRSTIERRFEAVMGRTIHAEIRRAQLGRAKDLITSTDLPLKQIAAMTSFGSIQHMTTLFRQQTGRTPAKYRRHAKL